MENDPAHAGMSHSERLKALSTITGLLEKYPRLADAVDNKDGARYLTTQAAC